jgi:acetylornithine aminotransferase
MLGTTFGGNHIACVAAIAVLDVMKKGKLMENAATVGNHLIQQLKGMNLPGEIRGMGLMIGFDTPVEKPKLRNELIEEHKILTGEAKPNVIRLLPPLSLTKQEADIFLNASTHLLKPVEA